MIERISTSIPRDLPRSFHFPRRLKAWNGKWKGVNSNEFSKAAVERVASES